MAGRLAPPHDITPLCFFEDWLTRAVSEDPDRRQRLAGVDAEIQFELLGEEGGAFWVRVRDGEVRGSSGRLSEPDLRLTLEVATWRALNAGELKAPIAAARGLLHFEGSLYLALKLHFILT